MLSSRVLGLVREQVFAAFFGAGAVFDAFVTAFRIPNLFRDLFAEGALSAAFVKTFSQELDRKGAARAWRLASLVLNVLAVVVGSVVVLGIVAAPWLVTAIAPGFDAEKTELTVQLTRVMFPFLWLVALAAVAMGVLNARDRFGVPALASTFFNAGSIVAGLLTAFAFEPGFMTATWDAVTAASPLPDDLQSAERAILGMAIGVLVGGALQFLCQTPSLARAGYRWSPIFDLRDRGLRDVLRLVGPAVIGTAAVQINVFVNNNFASRLEDGAVSWLNYAFRLMQFPIGVFGVAIATATLPAVSRAAARRDLEGFRATLGSSLRLALFLTVPSAAGLVVLGEPIVALIYERGKFLAADTASTAHALAFYAIGLVGYSAIKILAPAFYALDDPRVPARVAVLSIFVNVGLCALLVGPLGHGGLALSTALVATGNAVVLAIMLRRRLAGLEGRALLDGMLRIAAATAAMAAACHGARRALESLAPGPGLLDRILVVSGAIGVGAVVFLAAAHLLRVQEWRRLKEAWRGRRGG